MRENVDYMVLEVPSLRENVALARVTVAAFAARLPFTIAELEELKVAVSEGMTNAVVHGYPDGVGEVRIEAGISDATLTVTIIDYGQGMPAPEKEDGKGAGEDESTGMGFTFIESFTDSFSVDSPSSGGTRVQLTKRPAHRSETNE